VGRSRLAHATTRRRLPNPLVHNYFLAPTHSCIDRSLRLRCAVEGAQKYPNDNGEGAWTCGAPEACARVGQSWWARCRAGDAGGTSGRHRRRRQTGMRSLVNCRRGERHMAKGQSCPRWAWRQPTCPTAVRRPVRGGAARPLRDGKGKATTHDAAERSDEPRRAAILSGFQGASSVPGRDCHGTAPAPLQAGIGQTPGTIAGIPVSSYAARWFSQMTVVGSPPEVHAERASARAKPSGCQRSPWRVPARWSN